MKDSNSKMVPKKPWDQVECINNNNNSGDHHQEGDLLRGYPWPPRSYTCSFCKREFRSAQALGGHMNVHRRDRARLRHQSPPPPTRDIIDNGQNATSTHHHHRYLLNLNATEPTHHNPNLVLNPNPSFLSSSPIISTFPPFTTTPTLASSLLSPSMSTISSSSSPPCSTSAAETRRWDKNNGTLCSHLRANNKGPELTKKKTTSKALFGSQDFDAKKAEIVPLDLGIGLFSEKKQDLDLELRLGY